MRARETGSACNGSQLEAIFNDVIKQLTEIVIIIFEGSPRDFGPGFALQSTVASWSRRSRRGGLSLWLFGKYFRSSVSAIFLGPFLVRWFFVYLFGVCIR